MIDIPSTITFYKLLKPLLYQLLSFSYSKPKDASADAVVEMKVESEDESSFGTKLNRYVRL